MKKIYLIFLSIIMFVLPLGVVHAALWTPLSEKQLQQASIRLDTIQERLENSPNLDASLYESIQAIQDVKDQAKECAAAGHEQIKRIDELLQNESFKGVSLDANADYQYLMQQKNSVSKRTLACQTFVYKAQQLLSDYGDSIRIHAASSVLTSVQPVWSLLDDDIIQQFDVSPEKIFQTSGIKDLTAKNFYALAGLVMLALILANIIHSACKKALQVQHQNNSVARHTLSVVKRYIYFLLPVVVFTISIHAILYAFIPVPIMVHIAYAILIYFVVLALSDFTIYFPIAVDDQSYCDKTRRQLYSRIFSLATIIFLGYLAAVFLRGQELTQDFVDITRASYVTLLVFSVFWFSLAVFKIPFFMRRNHALLTGALKLFAYVMLVALIGSEWLGYHHTAVYILKGVILSVFFLILGWGVIVLIERTFSMLEDDSYQFSKIFQHLTSVTPERHFIEFYMLRAALYIVFAGITLLVMMYIWGASLFHIDMVEAGLLEGFALFNFTIYPMQIALGLVVFALIHMVGRIYSTRVANRYKPRAERDSQVAIASVINYASFLVAIIVGALVAGVDFTGLAIIAGALSVGIGFGLQNIANNFLSGLILLIQKPVKPGDRVTVGETEGFIRRIRVLSTQVKTMSKEDVIIPNADLLANPITNYMFRDSFWRVTCEVGVAYGSDTALVRKLLLEVADKHPDVMREGDNKPAVLFKSFGDSALLFELWTIIRDVNKKYHVHSDLNFAIDQIFREHNISIPFPQRDLHVKEVVQVDTEKK